MSNADEQLIDVARSNVVDVDKLRRIDIMVVCLEQRKIVVLN